MSTSTGDRIKELRIKAGLSQEELGDKVGLKKAAIHKYENGIVVNLKQSIIKALADALDTTPAYLMGWEDNERGTVLKFPSNAIPLPETVSLPIRGDIACGKPLLAIDEADEHAEVPANMGGSYLLRCRGDSMIGIHIVDGDLACIKSQPDVENGQVAAVEVDGEATLKRVRKIYNRANELVAIELHAENPTVEVMRYDGDEMGAIRIDGLLVGVSRTVRQ